MSYNKDNRYNSDINHPNKYFQKLSLPSKMDKFNDENFYYGIYRFIISLFMLNNLYYDYEGFVNKFNKKYRLFNYKSLLRCVFILFYCFPFSQAQVVDYAVSAGGSSYDVGYGIAS